MLLLQGNLPWISFLLGIALRLALFSFPNAVEYLGDRLDFSTSLTRFSEIKNEIDWPTMEGAHRPPIIIQLVRAGLANSFFFILVDNLVALVLFHSTRIHCISQEVIQRNENDILRQWNELGRPRLDSEEQQNETAVKDEDFDWSATSMKSELGNIKLEDLPSFISSLYMLSPFTILTCGARSFAPLTFLFVMAAVLFSQQQMSIAAGFCLSWVVYLDGPSYLFILVVPVLMMQKGFYSKILVLLSFVMSIVGLAFLSFKLNSSSWAFIQSSYLWVFSLPDSRPNIGLWWYLMTEVFSRYRPYFLLILHSFIYLCATPFAIYLYARPVLHVHFALAVLHTFQPYPEYFHFFTSLLLLFIHPQFLFVVPGLGALLLIMSFSVVMQPVMLYTWLNLNAGNANYFYFQTLIANGTLCVILIQIYLAIVTRDAVLRRVNKFLESEKKKH